MMIAKKNWFITLLFSLVVILLNLPLIFDVGFLSDDWDILARTQKGVFFSSIEEHHYSPFINTLFYMVGEHQLSPSWIHLLAFLIHSINIYLVILLCEAIGMNEWQKWFTGALFALSPAGFESLAWCCAIGYILCTTWVLIALQLTAELKQRHSFLFPFKIALLQLLAYLTWDWGIILTPSVILMKWIYCKEYSFRGTGPAISVWLGALIVKKWYGLSFGYPLNSISEAISHFGTSLMLTFWPEFSRSFYTSLLGITLAVITLLGCLYMAFKDTICRLGLLLFLLCCLPVILIGYPQSRYVYLSATFLYWIPARLFGKNIVYQGMAIIYLAAAIIWTIDRRDLWIEADLQARFYKKSGGICVSCSRQNCPCRCP